MELIHEILSITTLVEGKLRLKDLFNRERGQGFDLLFADDADL